MYDSRFGYGPLDLWFGACDAAAADAAAVAGDVGSVRDGSVTRPSSCKASVARRRTAPRPTTSIDSSRRSKLTAWTATRTRMRGSTPWTASSPTSTVLDDFFSRR